MISPANLYSQVLFDLNKDYYAQLYELDQALTSPDRAFFHSSVIPFSEKKKILEKLPLTEEIKNFLYELTRNHKWPYFSQICQSYRNLADQKKNILRGIIYTTHLLSLSEKEKIEESLKNFFKSQKILLEVKKKKNLIHGIRIEIGGFTLDDSVFNHLQQFTAQVRDNEPSY